MSKGYGVCQRLIMEKLASIGQEEYFNLVGLLPARHKTSDYQSLNRAAKTLHRAGKLELSYAGGLVIHYIGTEIKLAPNPQSGLNPETGYYYLPVIHKCILRAKLNEVDTYDSQIIVRQKELVKMSTFKAKTDLVTNVTRLTNKGTLFRSCHLESQ